MAENRGAFFFRLGLEPVTGIAVLGGLDDEMGIACAIGRGSWDPYRECLVDSLVKLIEAMRFDDAGRMERTLRAIVTMLSPALEKLPVSSAAVVQSALQAVEEKKRVRTAHKNEGDHSHSSRTLSPEQPLIA